MEKSIIIRTGIVAVLSFSGRKQVTNHELDEMVNEARVDIPKEADEYFNYLDNVNIPFKYSFENVAFYCDEKHRKKDFLLSASEMKKIADAIIENEVEFIMSATEYYS